ncbi:MAG: SPOR domain-containing protein [Candidatus Puniceispirillaceae bacterium]
MSDQDQQVSGVNWGWFAVLASIIVVVGMTTYFMLPGLISKTASDVTIVKAVDGPIKVKPAEPGGEKIDHQDLLVVDILKGGNKSDAQVESLRPAAPSPEPPPVIETDPNTEMPAASATAEPNLAMRADPATPVTPQPDTEPKKSLPKTKADTPKKPNSDDPAQIAAKPEPAAKSEAKATNQSKAEKAAISKIKKRVIVIEGDTPLYMIQLAAFRSAAKADEMAKILSAKHKSRLSDVELETMQVDTGSNGVFYRIVSVPLPRADADNICDVLRRSGQDCFLRKFTQPNP